MACADVLKRLEDARATGAIGSSLQAEIEVHAADPLYPILASLGDDLKYVSITSAVKLDRALNGATTGNSDVKSAGAASDARVADVASVASDGSSISVRASAEKKCDRCWHYRADVGQDASHPLICRRCSSNLFGDGDRRRFA